MEELRRDQWFAHCPTCGEQMDQVRASKRHPYVFHCSRCDPPMPSYEERVDLALAAPELGVSVCPGKPAKLDDGRVGMVIATVYQPDAYWMVIDGQPEKVLRERVTGRAA